MAMGTLKIKLAPPGRPHDTEVQVNDLNITHFLQGFALEAEAGEIPQCRLSLVVQSDDIEITSADIRIGRLLLDLTLRRALYERLRDEFEGGRQALEDQSDDEDRD